MNKYNACKKDSLIVRHLQGTAKKSLNGCGYVGQSFVTLGSGIFFFDMGTGTSLALPKDFAYLSINQQTTVVRNNSVKNVS